MAKKRVLFLCTGNSCRSQMAEAIVNARLGDAWEAHSAGTQPSGFVHPLTVKVLNEIGIEHEGRSKSADEFHNMPFDVVVTVCDDAAENCPVWLGKGRRAHLGFPDPGAATGTEDEVLAVFRRVRDDIATQVPELLGARNRWVERLFCRLSPTDDPGPLRLQDHNILRMGHCAPSVMQAMLDVGARGAGSAAPKLISVIHKMRNLLIGYAEFTI